MNERARFEELNALLQRATVGSGDVIVWLQGDRYDRGDVTLDLYKQGKAPKIVLSGNNVLLGVGPRPGEDNVSLEEMKSWLLERGVPEEAIEIESNSMNTRDQSLHICEMAKQRGWKSVIMVGSFPHYQARYYLTFLQGKKETGWNGTVIPAAAMLNVDQIPGGRDKTAGELMEEEFEKILAYQEKGHVASFEEGITSLS